MQQLGEGDALDVFHDDSPAAIEANEAIYLNNGSVAQQPQHAGFVAKAAGILGDAVYVGIEDL